MSRLPIRVRLTLPFALAMAVVLAVMGLVVYVRVGDALLASIDQSLRAAGARGVATLAQGEASSTATPRAAPSRGARRRADGRVLRSIPARLPRSVAGRSRRASSRASTLVRARRSPAASGDWRLLAVPSARRRRAGVLVVARSLEPREEALDRLARELLLAGPARAARSRSLAGYLLAAAALRPVEAMRRRAAAISASTPGAACRCRPRATRSRGSRRRSTTCSARWRRRSSTSGASSPTRATSCARRSRCSARSSSSRCAGRARTRSSRTRSARPREETERLTRLAEDLLLIARSDQGALPIRRERVSARELLDDVVDALRSVRRGSAAATSTSSPAPTRRRRRSRRGSSRRSATSSTTRSRTATAPSSSSRASSGDVVELHVARRRARASRPTSRRARSTASAAPTMPRSPAAPGSGSRSWTLIARAHGGEAAVANRAGRRRRRLDRGARKLS